MKIPNPYITQQQCFDEETVSTQAPIVEKTNQVSRAIFTEEMVKERCGTITSILRTTTRASIANQINLLSEDGKNHFLQSLSAYLDDGKLQHLDFNDQNFDYYALYALAMDKINLFQVATLFFDKAAVLETENPHEIQVHNLSDEEAKKIIKDNFSTPEQFLDELKIKHLFDRIIDKAPKSEQRFLMIPKEYEGWPLLRSILSVFTCGLVSSPSALVVFTTTGWDVPFGRYRNFCIIPSLSMVQAYLDVQFGDNAMNLRPVLGIPSSKSLLKMAKEDARSISLPSNIRPLPDMVHNYSARRLGWTFHDINHLTAASCIPKITRRAIVEIVEVLKRESKYEKIADEITELVSEHFMDAFGLKKTAPTFGTFLRDVDATPDMLFPLIDKHIQDNKDRWMLEYGITIEKYKEDYYTQRS